MTDVLSDMISAALEAQAAHLHVAMPGKIESYDASTQTADVRPLMQRIVRSRDDDQEDIREDLPILPSVPVLWPRGGGFVFHMPLAAGDLVLLIFCDYDTNQARENGPTIVEHHGLSGAVAIPGFFERGDPMSVGGASMELGSASGPRIEITGSEVRAGGSEDLALHAQLDAHLSAIAAGLDNVISIATAGATPAEPNYGTAAKALRDVTDPIPTTTTKGA